MKLGVVSAAIWQLSFMSLGYFWISLSELDVWRRGVNTLSAWRRKAIELFPEYQAEFEHPNAKICTVLIDLVALVKESHENNDKEMLKKIYGYAEWCHMQRKRAYHLWDGASVCFYEDIIAIKEALTELPYWVRHDIIVEMMPLWKMMYAESLIDSLKDVLKCYDQKHKTSYYKAIL